MNGEKPKWSWELFYGLLINILKSKYVYQYLSFLYDWLTFYYNRFNIYYNFNV